MMVLAVYSWEGVFRGQLLSIHSFIQSFSPFPFACPLQARLRSMLLLSRLVLVIVLAGNSLASVASAPWEALTCKYTLW